MKPELTEAEHYQAEELPVSDRKWFAILGGVFVIATIIGLYLTQ